MQILSDIRYADNHTMDAYIPAQEPAGAVIVLHSGWFGGDKADIAPLAKRLADAGLAVFAPSFRLPPHALFSVSRSDVLAAVNWVLASDFSIQKESLAIWGFSVGGTLAIEAALSTSLPAVAWSAMIDLKGFMHETTVLADRDYDHDFSRLSRASIEVDGRNDPLLRTLILEFVSNNASWLPTATPICRVTDEAGAILMFNAVAELVPSEGAMVLQRALSDVGVPSTVSILAGSTHGHGNLDAGFNQAVRFTKESFRIGVDGQLRASVGSQLENDRVQIGTVH